MGFYWNGRVSTYHLGTHQVNKILKKLKTDGVLVNTLIGAVLICTRASELFLPFDFISVSPFRIPF